MDKDVVDLIMFLDVCRIYLQKKKGTSNNFTGTLWAILTFIRTENCEYFLRWCRAYNVPFLRYAGVPKKKLPKPLSGLDDGTNVLRVLQQLFYCRCLKPPIVPSWDFE